MPFRSPLSIFLLLLCPLLLGMPVSATEHRFEGAPRIIDGDTLELGQVRIRLAGIDAPESKQTCTVQGDVWQCGTAATALLTQLVAAQPVTCRSHARDRYGRFVAKCERDGLDLSLLMIESGLAISLDGASEAYQQAAQRANNLGLGLWAGTFQTPREWRAANPRPSQPYKTVVPSASKPGPVPQHGRKAPASKSQCLIKGNRNRRGEWIYHMPGRPYYDQTRPEEIFCTEDEARQAGYRRSKA